MGHLPLATQWSTIKRYRRALCEIAGKRSPSDRHVDITINDRVDDPRRRILFAIVAVKRVANDIVNDTPRARACAGGVSIPSLPTICTPIFSLRSAGSSNERDMQVAILAIDEHIARSVIGSGSQRHVEIGRHAEHEIGAIFLESLAKESAALCAPEDIQLRSRVLARSAPQSCFRILRAFVRKRQIVWIAVTLSARCSSALNSAPREYETTRRKADSNSVILVPTR